MRIYESAEDYLETILFLTERNGSVRAIDIAQERALSKPSVSVAMKKLRQNGYIQVAQNGHIVLLPPGYQIAVKTAERHRLLASLLQKIGVSADIADKDACKIEHDLSSETFEKIRLYVEKFNLKSN